MAGQSKSEYPAIYTTEEQFRDIVAAEKLIHGASTVEELRSALLMVVGIMRYSLEVSVTDTERMYGLPRRV